LSKIDIISSEDGKSCVKLTLTEGKKNQVKRMFEAVGTKVTNLKRVQIGFLTLDGIPTGAYKTYTKREIYDALKLHEYLKE
jgi:pseudouridine synthase